MGNPVAVGYQAVEKRDLLRWASSRLPVCPMQTGVTAAYYMYASFLRIRPPCISSFCTGLPAMGFINCYVADS